MSKGKLMIDLFNHWQFLIRHFHGKIRNSYEWIDRVIQYDLVVGSVVAADRYLEFLFGGFSFCMTITIGRLSKLYFDKQHIPQLASQARHLLQRFTTIYLGKFHHDLTVLPHWKSYS